MYEQPRSYDVYFEARQQRLIIYLPNDCAYRPIDVEVRTMDNSYSRIYIPDNEKEN